MRPQLLLGAEEAGAGDHGVQHGGVALRLAHQRVQLLDVLRAAERTPAEAGAPFSPPAGPEPPNPATWKLLAYTSPLMEPRRPSTAASTVAAVAYSAMLRSHAPLRLCREALSPWHRPARLHFRVKGHGLSTRKLPCAVRTPEPRVR